VPIVALFQSPSLTQERYEESVQDVMPILQGARRGGSAGDLSGPHVRLRLHAGRRSGRAIVSRACSFAGSMRAKNTRACSAGVCLGSVYE
jgi:hypothetical protein